MISIPDQETPFFNLLPPNLGEVMERVKTIHREKVMGLNADQTGVRMTLNKELWYSYLGFFHLHFAW